MRHTIRRFGAGGRGMAGRRVFAPRLSGAGRWWATQGLGMLACIPA